MNRTTSEGNRKLLEIDQRPIDKMIDETVDPELCPLENSEVLKLSTLIPDWALNITTQNGSSVSHFERTIPKSPDNERAVGNAAAILRDHFESRLSIMLEESESLDTNTVYAIVCEGPVTAKTIRDLNEVDRQLAIHNVFGSTSY